MKVLILTILFVAIPFTVAQAQKKTVCYYGAWTNTLSSINPSICTHIMYSFIEVDLSGAINKISGDTSGVIQFKTLKNQNPSVKLMASFGGGNFGTSVFQTIAASPSLSATFATNALQFLQTYNFDGLDLDWEFPSTQSNANDASNFVFLLTALRSKLNPAGKSLAIAVAPDQQRAQYGYNIPQVAAQVDFINLMTYDFHGTWEAATNYQSALYSSGGDYSVANCVNYWLAQGAPADKLIVGIPLYGQYWTLNNANINGFGAPAYKSEAPQQYSYNQICAFVKNNEWTVQYDSQRGAAYATGNGQWTTYDETQTVDAKVNYINANNLGGAMFWSIEKDDYNNQCGGGNYPIISRVFNKLNAGATGSATIASISTTTKATTTTTTTTTKATATTSSSSSSGPFTCPLQNGIFAYPSDCSKYYSCGNGYPYLMSCGNGLVFNSIAKYCDYPTNFICNIQSVTSAPTVATTTKAPTQAPITQAPTIAATTTKAQTAAPTTTKASSSGTFTCPSATGLFANPADCTTFYNCANGVGALMNCGAGLGFNPTVSVCDWKANIPGCV